MQYRQDPEEDHTAIFAGMILLLLSAATAICVIAAAVATIRKVLGF